MTLCLGTPFEVSGTVHLQAPLAAKLSDPDIARSGAAVTAIRVENFPSAARYRVGRLKDRLAAYSPAVELDNARSSGLLGGDQDLARLCRLGPSAVAHLHHRHRAPPSSSPSSPAPSTSASLYDWSGGLIWLETPPTSDAGTVEIRRAIAEFGGHATLIRAERATRASVEVFQPLDPPLAALTAQAESSLRSSRHSQSRPHVSRSLGAHMHTNFSHEQLQDPTIARADAMLQALRPLRLLHRHLPDLCAARR